MLLTEISPTAAKVYLILSTLTRPNADPPVAQVRLKTLARLANLAPRTCSAALRQLLDLKLLTRLPRRDAAPTAYVIAPLHYTHLDAPSPARHAHRHAPTPPNAHPDAPSSPTPAHPDAPASPTRAHPHAPAPAHTLLPNSKTHQAHPHAPNTTKSPEERLLDGPLNPALLQFLMSALSPDERAAILAPHQSKIAALAAAAKKEAPGVNPGLGGALN